MKADLYRATIEKYMSLRHINNKEQLRAHTTVGSSTTFLKWWHNPELLPIEVYFQIMTALKVPEVEQFEILKK